MSDRWTDETAELVALATGAHHLDPNWTDVDGHSRCVCGGWVDGEMNPGWDDHMAEVSLAALADAGLLLPPDAIRRTEQGRVYQDGRLLPIEATRRIWETPWLPEALETIILQKEGK